MSAAQQAAAFGNAGKKAVHVKWAGKTIALGTFPASEADEKCARAKALTRAWRSTMRPKPSRDWVMLELERLGVRVVSGRLGRKTGEEGDEGGTGVPMPQNNGVPDNKKAVHPGGPVQGVGAPPMERSNSLGWGGDADLLMASRRNSSLGMSMIGDNRRGSLNSLGHVVGLESTDPHRPLVGGGPAAAYEAARHDHLIQKSAEQHRRTSSMGLGSLAGGGLGNMGVSVNPNQHYEMLKLHHMNLLNEIQETTLMMNLYQQQQLQQQQQQLQQQEHIGASDAQVAMLLQHQQNQGGGGGGSLDPMFGAAQLSQQRDSLGLGVNQMGGGGGGGFNAQQQLQQMQQLQQQQQMLQNATAGMQGGVNGSDPVQSDLVGGLPSMKNDLGQVGVDQGVMLNDNHKRGMDGGDPADVLGNKRQKLDGMKEPKENDGEDEDDDDHDDDNDDDDGGEE